MYDLGLLLVELTITILIVAALLATVGRRRPRLAYALGLVALLKCLTPGVLASPTGLFSWAELFRTHQIVSEPRRSPFASIAVLPEPVHSEPWHYTLMPRAKLLALRQPKGELSPPQNVQLQAGRGFETLLAVWLAGSAIMGGLLFLRWRRARQAVAAQGEPASEAVSHRADSLRQRLGLRSDVPILVSRNIGPISFGVRQPTVVVPASVAEGRPEALELVLAHELMHLKRRDPLWSWLQIAAQVIWWFHPLVWWLNRRICADRERACDEQVLKAMACRPDEYARCLLEVLELRLHPQLGFAFAAMPAWGMRERFRQIFYAATARSTSPVWRWLAATVLAALLLPSAPGPNAMPAFTASLGHGWRAAELLHLPQLPHVERHRARVVGRLRLSPSNYPANYHRGGVFDPYLPTWHAHWFVDDAISPDEWTALANTPSVMTLQLEIGPNGDGGQVLERLNALSGLQNLRRLTLGTPVVTDRALAAIASFESLEWLTLHGHWTGPYDYGAASAPSKGEQGNSRLTRTGWESLGRLRRLNYLTLCLAADVDPWLAPLQRLEELSQVDLVRMQLGDPPLDDLARVASLERVRVFGADLSSEAAALERRFRLLKRRTIVQYDATQPPPTY